ncbi:MAG: hypothetical protein JRH20_32775 [Deltaproteobacteria bacterium]|nr:hypothetical protein [Deltaproteobacteria bacterium]
MTTPSCTARESLLRLSLFLLAGSMATGCVRFGFDPSSEVARPDGGKDITFDGSAPGDTAPGDTAPGDTAPGDAPGDAPSETAPGDTTRDATLDGAALPLNHLWSRVMGGTSDNYGYGVAVDSEGNITLVGEFYGTVSSTAPSILAAAASQPRAKRKSSSPASPPLARTVGSGRWAA